jgi:hypothetical protein
VLSLVTTLACGQSHAGPLVSDATACDAAKVDARNVVQWVLCHNQVDARLDKYEPHYLSQPDRLSSRAKFIYSPHAYKHTPGPNDVGHVATQKLRVLARRWTSTFAVRPPGISISH